MGQVNALDGMFDLLGSECGIGVHEVLVNGEGDQIDSIDKGMAFELLQVGDVFRIHLPMQDVNPFHSQIGGSIDDRLYRHLWIAEVPVGVGRNAKLDSVVKGVYVLLMAGLHGLTAQPQCGQAGKAQAGFDEISFLHGILDQR